MVVNIVLVYTTQAEILVDQRVTLSLTKYGQKDFVFLQLLRGE